MRVSTSSRETERRPTLYKDCSLENSRTDVSGACIGNT